MYVSNLYCTSYAYAVCRKENGDIFSTFEKNGAAQTERGFPNKETNGEKEFYEIVFSLQYLLYLVQWFAQVLDQNCLETMLII